MFFVGVWKRRWYVFNRQVDGYAAYCHLWRHLGLTRHYTTINGSSVIANNSSHFAFITTAPFICCVFCNKAAIPYNEWRCASFTHLTRWHGLKLIPRLAVPYQLQRLSYAASNEEKCWSRSWKDMTVAYFAILSRICLDRQLVIYRDNLILQNIQVEYA